MMYDISKPEKAEFVSYTINRDFTKEIESELSASGDLAPEGFKFVTAEDSPTGSALLLVGNEVSGSTSVYEIK